MIANESTEAPAQYQDLFKQFAGAIQNHLELKGAIDEAKVAEIVDAKITEARMPRPLEVHLPDGTVVNMSGRQHVAFDEVLSLVQEGAINIMLVGPAGSGKTTLVKSIAKALSRDFGFISLSQGITETHLFGRLLPQEDGTWAYVSSRFVDVYENGGVFLLDEMDAADSNVMVAINAALANGIMSNPVSGKQHVRHADCIIIAAANTYGQGGDQMYVGRNALDAATVDRFVLDTIHVGYDADLEREIMQARGLTAGQVRAIADWIETLRSNIAEYRLRRVASTRLVERAARSIKCGKTLDSVKARYFQNWTRDERAKVGE